MGPLDAKATFMPKIWICNICILYVLCGINVLCNECAVYAILCIAIILNVSIKRMHITKIIL